MKFNPLGLRGVGIACAIAFAAGSCSTWKVRDWMADHAKVKVLTRTIRIIERRNVVTDKIATKAAEAQVRIRTVTRTIVERTPEYVPPAADAQCSISNGFVRLHDAAAQGAVPDPPGPTDGAPSGVALSTVASTVAGNYGDYHAVARQLTDLQDWITAQMAVK